VSERVGVLGGSFDPVHEGHLHVARCGLAARGLTRVVFVPARAPPHKPDVRLASDVHRLAMLELALAGEPRFEISRIELERAGPSYTVDTLRALPEQLGLAHDARLYLLLGGDNLAGLPGWRGFDEILRRAEPLVVVRAGDERALLDGLRGRLDGAALEALERGLIAAPPRRVSATALRAALARGEDPGADLPAAVADYARTHGVYGAP
jgi:nicotinate-nucleotide adenylyltransferase